MEWHDEGTILLLQRHGERALRLEVFTASHGRHAGILRSGRGKADTGLQPGTRVAVTWRARLAEHLGMFTLDPLRGRAAALMQSPAELAGLSAICAVARAALPERQPFPDFHQQTENLLDLLAMTPAWSLAYLQWEVALLSELGFALDLERCAVTGQTDALVYVSPKTGRAVSREGAGEWADRMLPLPPVLRGEGKGEDKEIALALQLTGHFLARALDTKPEGLPGARSRLVAALAR